MKLTGKAKQDFEFWLRDYYEINRKDYNKYPFPVILKKYYRKTDIEKNALIIEWFDSLKMWDYAFYVEYCVNQNYKEATEEAIKQCNIIYNNIK